MKGIFLTAVLTVFVNAILDVAYAQDAGTLSPLVGRNLNDQEIGLPSDLPQEPTLIIMTFEQNQQGQADRWLVELQKLNPNIDWMELAVIQPVNAFVRGMITSGMRRGIQDALHRARFVTIFAPPAPIAKALRCSQALKAVCVAVVERSGHVRDVESGEFSSGSANSLIDSLNH